MRAERIGHVLAAVAIAATLVAAGCRPSNDTPATNATAAASGSASAAAETALTSPSADVTGAAPIRAIAGLAIGTVRDDDVVRRYGEGLLVGMEGHGGGRYYANADKTVTLHVEIGPDGSIETVELIDGLYLPKGMKLSDEPRLVSGALGAAPPLDRGVRLGTSFDAVVKALGQPADDQRNGARRTVTYQADDPDNYSAELTFVQDRLRVVSVYCGE